MRAQSHILETIACRTFERKLSDVIVTNPPLQGRDYGWDFQCTDFDSNGQISREFKVQVKHLRELEEVAWDECTYLYQYRTTTGCRPCLASHSIETAKIKTWIHPAKSPGTMLFVMADKWRIVFVWLQDLYDFYFKWIPLDTAGSTTIYLTDIRQLVECRGLPTLWMDAEYKADGWIDGSVSPGNLDAVFHMGLSLYLRCIHCGTRFLANFDSRGFFQMLLQRADQEPHVMLAFGAFLGQLTPSHDAVEWACGVVASWENPWFIPAAIQVLSKSNSEFGINAIMSRFEVEPPGAEGTRVILKMVIPPWRQHADWRFGAEFNIAAGTFLERQVHNSKCSRAQKILVNCFIEWNPTLRYPNLATTAIKRLLAKRRLIKSHDSYAALLKYAGLSGEPELEQFTDALEDLDRKWWEECVSR